METHKPNSFGVQDLSPYQIHARKEIIALLLSIKENNQLVSLLVNGGKNAIVTSILHVDEVTDKVVIDCAPSALVNQSIVESHNISFETVLDHIRILFFASKAESCLYESLPALRIDLPPY